MSTAVVAEPVSPELVLVTPELREYALSLLPDPRAFAPPRMVTPIGSAPVDLRRAALAYGLFASARTLALAIGVASGFALIAIAAQLAS